MLQTEMTAALELGDYYFNLAQLVYGHSIIETALLKVNSVNAF